MRGLIVISSMIVMWYFFGVGGVLSVGIADTLYDDHLKKKMEHK